MHYIKDDHYQLMAFIRNQGKNTTVLQTGEVIPSIGEDRQIDGSVLKSSSAPLRCDNK
jgi:hypothetical protein